MGTVAQLLVSGILLGGIYALISVGLTLIFGVMRLTNFAHGEFVMLAMYATYWLHVSHHISPAAAVIIVPLLMLLAGAVTYWLIIRRAIGSPPVVQIFATAGLSIALQNLALMLWSGDFRTISWAPAQITYKVGPVFIALPRLEAFVVAMLTALFVHLFLTRTKFGTAVRATAQDRWVAELVGVNVNLVYFVTFSLGIALVGVAGSVMMPIYHVDPTVGLVFALVSFVVVILGGLGSFAGAVVGGLIVGIVESLSGYYIGPAWQQAVYFIVFVAVLAIKPAGLFGIRGAEEFGFK